MSHYLTMRSIGHPVAYFPKLGVYLGNVKAAILLGQLIYWSDKTDNPLGVYKSSEDINRETGLSYREQVTSRKILVAAGLITETEKRIDHKIYFKFEHAAFDKWLDSKLSQDIDFIPNAENAVPEQPKAHSANIPERIPPSDKNAVPEQPKAHSANIPERIPPSDKNAVPEQPKAHSVIQKNTTKNTTDINNTSDEVVSNDSKVKTESKKAFSFSIELKKLGADDQLIADWAVIRKAKRGRDTQTAFDGFVREYKKSGQDINTIIRVCIERNWNGFNNSWNWQETAASFHPQSECGQQSTEQQAHPVNIDFKVPVSYGQAFSESTA